MDEMPSEVDASMEATPLAALREEESSILSLLRILLSGKTLPHLVLIALLTGLFQFLASSGNDVLSALGFLSLSGGYLLTGLMAGFGPVQRWIQLPEDPDEDAQGRFKRLLLSFRICIFPLLMAGVVFASLMALVGEQGALGDFTEALPLVLSTCFVVWAIVQGRGFGRWLASVAASKLPDGSARDEGLSFGSSGFAFALVLFLSAVLLVVFEWLADSTISVVDGLISNVPFFGILLLVFGLSWRRSRDMRLQASSRADFHRFSKRWMLLTQLMISWHLLTVWRHWAIAPGGALLFVEEFLLMIFTVVMAIWGLTSKSYRSSLRLVNVKNALPMGLAFGYAYAGSVAMLTTVLDDVRNVMMAGHFIVVMTFLWMQPRMLEATMGGVVATERIQKVVSEAVPAPSPAETPDDTEQSSSEAVSPDETSPDSNAARVTAVPIDGEASSNEDRPADAIGEAVSWSAPEVLANDVAWDDDDIELVD